MVLPAKHVWAFRNGLFVAKWAREVVHSLSNRFTKPNTMNSILRFSTLAIALFGAVFSNEINGQGCDELFISEYIEGWGNNKAIELYNPKDYGVNLSDYRIERYANGATSAADNQKLQLSGIMPPNTVVVIVLDKQDPDGVDFEAPVWDARAAVANLPGNIGACPVYAENNTMYFNGNDALVLRKISSNDVIDVFGKVGEDPGDAGWANMTQNHTLIRKTNVVAGDLDAVDDFLVVDEWNGTLWSADDTLFTTDIVFDNLGTHTCDCGTSKVSDRVQSMEMEVFPNPVTGEALFVRSAEAIREIVLHNLTGQAVMRQHALGQKTINVSMVDAPIGMYLLEVIFDNGARVTQRVVRK